MPALIKTIYQIMQEQRRNTYFVRFGDSLSADDDAVHRAKEEHLAWFGVNGVLHEKAAPDGWLEGDPGCFAVYFDGPDDSRLAAYCADFEQPSGFSVKPELYQMYLAPYRSDDPER